VAGGAGAVGPIEFSTTHVCHDSIGGGVVLEIGECDAPAFRVSRAAEHFDSGWVTVSLGSEIVAMTLGEAFARGLRETLIPRAAA
jgi:hypothetical protein